MTQKAFLRTKYARQLISDIDKIERDWIKFNSLWEQFWSGNSTRLGDILTCHLIIEFHLTNWLSAANPGLPSLDDLRLSFSQKLKLVDGVDEAIQLLIPGMACINKIRNAVAHNISVDLNKLDLSPLRSFVWPWHDAAGKPKNEGTQLIKDFTLIASGLLYGQSKSIERYAKGDGIITYQRWAKNATKSDGN